MYVMSVKYKIYSVNKIEFVIHTQKIGRL